MCPTDGLLKSAVVPSADGRVVYVTGAREDDPSRSDIYSVAADCDHPVAVTKEPGYKAGIVVDPTGGVPALRDCRREPVRETCGGGRGRDPGGWRARAVAVPAGREAAAGGAAVWGSQDRSRCSTSRPARRPS